MWKLAEKGEYERLHEYIGKLRPLEKDRHRQWTQNLILDMILEYKLLAMEKKKILYEIKTDMIGEIALADKELCILLGNLLDNAIEACEKLEEEKRMVKIEVRKHHSMFMLRSTCTGKKGNLPDDQKRRQNAWIWDSQCKKNSQKPWRSVSIRLKRGEFLCENPDTSCNLSESSVKLQYYSA